MGWVAAYVQHHKPESSLLLSLPTITFDSSLPNDSIHQVDMARPHPHPLALFSLVPLNDRALAVLTHPDNTGLVSTLADGRLGLDVGFHVGSSSRYTLATLGRSGADITVEGSSISRIQCSFEIHEEYDVVMLYDRSNSLSTQVSGTNATPFERGRARRIVMGIDFNTEIGIGGVSCDLIRFSLEWHQNTFDVEEQVKNRVDNPRLARTVDEAPTVLPSQRLTRIHTPGNREPRIRYAKLVELGRGQFGEVWKAVDVDLGRIFAVKMIKQPVLGFQAGAWVVLKREVETLSQISHVSQSFPSGSAAADTPEATYCGVHICSTSRKPG